MKKKLLEISICGIMQRRKFRWGVGSGWRTKTSQRKAFGNDGEYNVRNNSSFCGFIVDNSTVFRLLFCLEAK